jgi:hypothetical protein
VVAVRLIVAVSLMRFLAKKTPFRIIIQERKKNERK